MDVLADPLRRRAVALADRLRTGSAAGSDLADASPALHSAARTARAAAFWAGIALPFVHLPLLLSAGLTASTTPLLVALWSLHALSLAVGAGHASRPRDTDSESTPTSPAGASGVPCDD